MDIVEIYQEKRMLSFIFGYDNFYWFWIVLKSKINLFTFLIIIKKIPTYYIWQIQHRFVRLLVWVFVDLELKT